jgi:hypothetical protein
MLAPLALRVHQEPLVALVHREHTAQAERQVLQVVLGQEEAMALREAVAARGQAVLPEPLVRLDRTGRAAVPGVADRRVRVEVRERTAQAGPLGLQEHHIQGGQRQEQQFMLHQLAELVRLCSRLHPAQRHSPHHRGNLHLLIIQVFQVLQRMLPLPVKHLLLRLLELPDRLVSLQAQELPFTQPPLEGQVRRYFHRRPELQRSLLQQAKLLPQTMPV